MRFYNCVIHPKEDNGFLSTNGDGCPTDFNDCDHCEHRKYIGTFGGEFYVDCSYDEK